MIQTVSVMTINYCCVLMSWLLQECESTGRQQQQRQSSEKTGVCYKCVCVCMCVNVCVCGVDVCVYRCGWVGGGRKGRIWLAVRVVKAYPNFDLAIKAIKN